MAAFKLDLKLDQGATNRKLVTWKTGTPAQPVNLTGCSAKLQVRQTHQALAVLLELSTQTNTIVLGGVNGTVELVFTPLSTQGAQWTQAVYDLEVTLANGDVRRLLEGSVTLSPEVTRG